MKIVDGCSGVLAEYNWTRDRHDARSTLARSTASNHDQVANLLCAQANSASSAGWEMNIAYLARGYGVKIVWLIGSVVCLLAVPRVQLSVSAGNKWPHNALRYHELMPISCHFGYCNALLFLSLTHVSSAVASVQTFNYF